MKTNSEWKQQLADALTDIELNKLDEWDTSLEESASLPDSLKKAIRKNDVLSRIRRVGRMVGRVAVILILVLLGSFSATLLISKTARSEFIRWTSGVFEGKIYYLFYGKEDEEYKLPKYKPSWLPDGVKLMEIQGNSSKSYSYWYQNDDESIIILFGVDLVHEGSLMELTQMEDYEHETIQYEGKTIEHYYLGEEDHTVLWFEDNDRVILSVDCYLKWDELLTFIKNIRRVD